MATSRSLACLIFSCMSIAFATLSLDQSFTDLVVQSDLEVHEFISAARLTTTEGVVCYTSGSGGNTKVICKRLRFSDEALVSGTATEIYQDSNSADISVTRFSDTVFVVCYLVHGDESPDRIVRCKSISFFGDEVRTSNALTIGQYAKAGLNDLWFSGSEVSVTSLSETRGVVCYEGAAPLNCVLLKLISETQITKGTPMEVSTGVVEDHSVSISRFSERAAVVCYADTSNGLTKPCVCYALGASPENEDVLLKAERPLVVETDSCKSIDVVGLSATRALACSRLGSIRYMEDSKEDKIISCKTMVLLGSDHFDKDWRFTQDTYLFDDTGDGAFAKIALGKSLFGLVSVDRFSDTFAVVCWRDFDRHKSDTTACVGLNIADERTITKTERALISDSRYAIVTSFSEWRGLVCHHDYEVATKGTLNCTGLSILPTPAPISSPTNAPTLDAPLLSGTICQCCFRDIFIMLGFCLASNLANARART